MSTNFISTDPIPWEELKNIDRDGLSIADHAYEGNENDIVITDGTNYIHAYGPGTEKAKMEFPEVDGKRHITVSPIGKCTVVTFTKFGGNNPSNILEILGNIFKVGFINEHQDAFMPMLERRCEL